MKKLLTVLLLLAALAVEAQEVRFNGIKPTFVIDVRTSAEFAAGHIEGALNIPVEQIGQGIKSIKGLRKNSPILVYCRSGRRSAHARFMLEQQGFNRVLDGGGMATLARQINHCTAKSC